MTDRTLASRTCTVRSHEHVHGGLVGRLTGPHVFFCGTTRKSLCRFDRRKGGDPVVTAHDAMINTLCVASHRKMPHALVLTRPVCAPMCADVRRAGRYVAQDGMTVITGDATGQIVTWDVRTSTSRTSLCLRTATRTWLTLSLAPRRPPTPLQMKSCLWLSTKASASPSHTSRHRRP